MKVRQVMSSPPISVHESMTAGDVARLMMDKDIGAVVVVDDDGRLRGLITESDFTGVARCVPFTMELAPVIFGSRAASLRELEAIYAQAKTLPASRIMSEKVTTCQEDDDIGAVVHTMLKKKLKHVPVVRGEKVVGMVARHDVLGLIASSGPA
jgi:CBS domain-containing protein